MPIHTVRVTLNRLRNRKNQPIKLPFPISPTLRLAQISEGPKFAGVEPIYLKRWSNLNLLSPNVVAGFTSQLQHLAEVAVLGALDVSSVDHAVVALTRYGTPPLTDPVRVTLWQAFGVPIFELYLGPDHSLLAAECEAHEGWHPVPGVAFSVMENGELVIDGAGHNGLRTGLRALVEPGPCPCGRSSLRLLDVESANGPEALFQAVSA
jgi:hypothetical protein